MKKGEVIIKVLVGLPVPNFRKATIEHLGFHLRPVAANGWLHALRENGERSTPEAHYVATYTLD